MTEGRRSAFALARWGFTDHGATDTVTKLGWWHDGQIRPEAEDTVRALSRAPDPNLALRTLARLANAAGAEWTELNAALDQDVGLRGRLLGVLGSSTALGDHLVARPQRWHGLACPEAVQPSWAGRAAQRLLGADTHPPMIYVRTTPDQTLAVRNVLARITHPAAPQEVDVARPSDILAARAIAKGAYNALLLGLGAI